MVGQMYAEGECGTVAEVAQPSGPIGTGCGRGNSVVLDGILVRSPSGIQVSGGGARAVDGAPYRSRAVEQVHSPKVNRFFIGKQP